MPGRDNTPWELLVSGQELLTAATVRGKKTHEIDVRNNDITDKQNDGWTIKKQFARKARMVKDKNPGETFEDELWCILYKMGFKVLNATNKFYVVYGRTAQVRKQIDIVAIDDETCLCIECKAADRRGTNRDFRQDINEIIGYKEKVFDKLLQQFPGRKCKFIFAVKDYNLGTADHDRLKEDDIYFFDNSTINYLSSLVGYIGTAARYQLLSSLFAGEEIEGLQNKVPAIKGRMGGVDYYTFLIEPETLLKIGYVLHRTNANNAYEELLPSYQRLIKKDRLEKVQRFISDGGFFPNSLVISIEIPEGIVEFSPVRYQNRVVHNVGVLSLPKTYQSAFIIDGQHRLYGFANNNHSTECTIPVVAFVNLNKETQLKLFMDINENQKAVPKPLRNLLEIEVFYDSPKAQERKKALLGKIAKKLGEDRESPLYGRVVIGEDARTDICCITMEAIKIALDKTDLFNTYKSSGKLEKEGLLEHEGSDNDTTYGIVYPIYVKILKQIAEQCESVWNDTNSYITNNNGVVAVLRIIADIIDIVTEKVPGLIDDVNALVDACRPFASLLSDTINELSPENREEVRTTRGTSGQEKPYRIIQMAMRERDLSFTNDRIESYYIENFTNYNDAAQNELNSILKTLVDYTRSVFTQADWMGRYLSQDHEIELTTRYNTQIVMLRRRGDENATIDIWNLLTLDDMVKVIGNGTNWTDCFKQFFADHHFEMTKIELLFELKTIASYAKKIADGVRITRTNYNMIADFNNKLIGDNYG